MISRKRIFSIAIIAFVAMILLAQGAEPQIGPQLDFHRITYERSHVELAFNIRCNGKKRFDVDEKQMLVFENENEISGYVLHCYNVPQRSAVSLAIVFDGSGSMGGVLNSAVINAGSRFISSLDGLSDEAMIMWFTLSVTIGQGMTADKSRLREAISRLPAAGSTAIWDGIYTSMKQLARHASNPSKALVLVTDGEDRYSEIGVQEVVSLAILERISVYVVCIGDIPNAELESVSQLTNGKCFYSPTLGELVPVYDEISSILFSPDQDCTISYRNTCYDGTNREVKNVLDNYCGGSDTKTRSYQTPLKEYRVHRLFDEMKCYPKARSYQWFLDDVLIPGATTRIYQFHEDGEYRVLATDDYGCSVMSGPYHTILGIEDPAPALARVFDISPNPTSGAININLEFDTPTSFDIRIVDVTGGEVYSEKILQKVAAYNTQITLEGQPKAVYFVSVGSGKRTDRRKIVLQ